MLSGVWQWLPFALHSLEVRGWARISQHIPGVPFLGSAWLQNVPMFFCFHLFPSQPCCQAACWTARVLTDSYGSEWVPVPQGSWEILLCLSILDFSSYSLSRSQGRLSCWWKGTGWQENQMFAYDTCTSKKKNDIQMWTLCVYHPVFRFITSFTTVAKLNLISLLVEMNYVSALWELNFFSSLGFKWLNNSSNNCKHCKLSVVYTIFHILCCRCKILKWKCKNLIEKSQK